jgi:arylamine N-acetyltransferase
VKSTIEDYMQKAGSIMPNYANLEAIHTLFVHEPVFNSFNILLDNKPKFDPEIAYQKVVREKISDTCRMINLAAKYLLDKIGYKSVQCFACEVSHIHNIPVPAGTAKHMTMIVTLVNAQGAEVMYLFDPGFGNGHRKPLPLTGEIVEDLLSPYRVIVDPTGRYAVQEFFGEWKTQFLFKPQDVINEAAFDNYVNFVHQDSHFFRNTIYVQKSSPEGCIAIYNNIFRIHSRDGTVEEKSVLAEGGLRRLLIDKFGMPKCFIDSLDLNSPAIKPEVRDMLKGLWHPSAQVSSIGWISDDEGTPPAKETVTRIDEDNRNLDDGARRKLFG